MHVAFGEQEQGPHRRETCASPMSAPEPHEPGMGEKRKRSGQGCISPMGRGLEFIR